MGATVLYTDWVKNYRSEKIRKSTMYWVHFKRENRYRRREDIKFILEMRIPKLIEVKVLAKGQTAGKWQSWDSDAFPTSGHSFMISDIFKQYFLDNCTVPRIHEPGMIMQKQLKDNQRILESSFFKYWDYTWHMTLYRFQVYNITIW